MSCSGEGCNSPYIQNKKHNLCGECVFKKSHDGKNRQEVYSERSRLRSSNKAIALIKIEGKVIGELKPLNIYQDEESLKNERNQNAAEDAARQDELEGLSRFLKPVKTEKKKSKSVKRITEDQKEINAKYKIACADMDHITEPVCTGCLRYQGGDIILSHSHIISRKECKEIGRPELIYSLENLTYHCLDFGENEGCHRIWENPKRRHELKDYQKNTEYINRIKEEVRLNKQSL